MRKPLCARAISIFATANMRSYTLDINSNHARSMLLIDGKGTANRLNKELQTKIKKWVSDGHRVPHLTCVLVGKNEASETYVRAKTRAAEEVGMSADVIKFDDNISEEFLINKIYALNKDKNVDGILIQLPLPPQMSERHVCNAVSSEKDVDGFNIVNVGKLSLDEPCLVPATALGVIKLLKIHNIPTHGKNVVVVGRSKNVGMPIAMLLHTDAKHASGLGMDATVTICHRYTPLDQLKWHCLNADIIISATGVPHLIKADMVRPGATVIDVGLTRVVSESGKNKCVGDVDFEEVKNVAGAITPVPGGVGPMTVAMVLHNTYQAAETTLQNSITPQ